MNGRELHSAIYSGEPFDRLPVHGVWPWAEALERWRQEGLPAGVYWKKLYEERFRPELAGRLPADWAEQRADFHARAATRWVSFFCFPLGGLFGGLRQLLGLEGLSYAIADDPELVHAMVDDLTDFWTDSDGFFAPLLPDMMACGITGTSPCEVQADMDVGELRAAFPSLNFCGGIDKRALVRGPTAIEDELRRRFTTAWEKGRYCPCLDHGAPPDIPWHHVQHYAPIYRHYCYEAPGKQ